MIKDTKEGQTHSFNDGCGDPAHNQTCCKNCGTQLTDQQFQIPCDFCPCHSPKDEVLERVLREFEKVRCNCEVVYGAILPPEIKPFILRVYTKAKEEEREKWLGK